MSTLSPTSMAPSARALTVRPATEYSVHRAPESTMSSVTASHPRFSYLMQTGDAASRSESDGSSDKGYGSSGGEFRNKLRGKVTLSSGSDTIPSRRPKHSAAIDRLTAALEGRLSA